jgi:hypothetical protein
MNPVILLVALAVLVYAAICAEHQKWFPRFGSYDPASRSYGWSVEGFQAPSKPAPSTPAVPVAPREVIGVNANDKADANLANDQPYHLLQDERANARPQLSTVSTAGCYATDMEQHLSKVGNHRQLTNNYRRAGPDSCSAPWKELLFHFYEMTPFHL